MTTPSVTGQTIPAGELLVAQQAVRDVANTLTFAGITVGKYITDEQCAEVSIAVVSAIETFRNRGTK